MPSLIIAAFTVAVILLIVYLVRINRTREKYLGKDAVNKIAEDAAKKSLIKQTFITCDYCGNVIDTSKNQVCPFCGAAYGTDEEWQNRQTVDQDEMNRRIEAKLESNKAKVKNINAESMKKVKLLTTIISIVIIFFVIVIIIGIFQMTRSRYDQDISIESYENTGYVFTDDVIAENETIGLKFGDIYSDDGTFYVEVLINNKTGKSGHLEVFVPAANGKCITTFLYEDVSPEENSVKYIELYSYLNIGDILKSMVISDIRFTDHDYNELFKNEETLAYITDADISIPTPKTEGEILFEKNGLQFSTINEEDELYFRITNTGEYNFQISTYSSSVDGNDEEIWVYVFVPAGCYYAADLYYNIGLQEGDHIEEMKIQLECRCPEHPEMTFVTDLIDLPVK